MKTLVTCLLVAIWLTPWTQAQQQKLVLAHYMTNMLPDNADYDQRWINPELSKSQG